MRSNRLEAKKAKGTFRTWAEVPKPIPSILRKRRIEREGIEPFVLRWEAMLSYFGIPNDDPDEFKKLLNALLPILFPCFREPVPGKVRRVRGGRSRYHPKYEVDFLKRAAVAYDEVVAKTKKSSSGTVSHEKLRKAFQKAHPEIASAFSQSKLGWFEKLIRVGRKARTSYVIWRPRAGRNFPWRSGEYIELPPEIAGVYEALRHVYSLGSDAPSLQARLLALDPVSREGRQEIAGLTKKAEELLRRQLDLYVTINGIPTKMSSFGMAKIDPFWLLKKYRRKKSEL
jgi:hypothetical protein